MPTKDETATQRPEWTNDAASEERRKQAWQTGEAFDQRMEELVRDAPRPPRQAPDKRRRR
jgi:hypothetical protein